MRTPSGLPHTQSLYYCYDLDARRPGVWVNESNTLEDHSGEFADWPQDTPECVKHFDEEFVTNQASVILRLRSTKSRS